MIEVYFGGCNIGGQLHSRGEHIEKRTIYALVGKGYEAGSMFKLDINGENYYKDGEMLPANIVLTYRDIKKKTSSNLKVIDYMKKFSIK